MQTENESIQTNHKTPSTKKRIILFLITYIAAALVVTGIFVVRTLVDQLGLVDPAILARTLPKRAFGNFCYTLLLLPVGFVLALEWVFRNIFGLHLILVSGFQMPDTPFQAISQGLSYLLFLSISLTSTFTKNRQTFRIIYSVFLAVLIIAIGGCTSLH